jgi:hypothetical protein
MAANTIGTVFYNGNRLAEAVRHYREAYDRRIVSL